MSSHTIDLSKGQAQKLIDAIKKSSPIRMRFTAKQLKGKRGIDLPLNKTQKNKINKAIKNNKGVMLSFSKPQVVKMKKHGGVAPALAALAPLGMALLTGALGAAGTFGATKLLETIDEKVSKKPSDQGGFGLAPPGFTGQTGNSVPGFQPTNRGTGRRRIQNGGRRDSRKPAKPVFHPTDRILRSPSVFEDIDPAIKPLAIEPRKQPKFLAIDQIPFRTPKIQEIDDDVRTFQSKPTIQEIDDENDLGLQSLFGEGRRNIIQGGALISGSALFPFGVHPRGGRGLGPLGTGFQL